MKNTSNIDHLGLIPPALRDQRVLAKVLGIADVAIWKVETIGEGSSEELHPIRCRGVFCLGISLKPWVLWFYDIDINDLAVFLEQFFFQWHPPIYVSMVPRYITQLQTHIGEIDKHYDRCNEAWATGEVEKFKTDKLHVSITKL